ncbi:MAG: hypothetical protein AB9903_31165 [Vulcanimicrobiota bacterium]
MRIAGTFVFIVFFLITGSGALLSKQPPTLGTVLDTKGDVWVVRGEDKSPLTKRTEILLGDFVETGKESNATLNLQKPYSRLYLNSSSLFHTAQKNDDILNILDEGQARVTIKGLGKKLAFFVGDSIILCNEAVFDISRTGKDRYLLYVLEGKVWWVHQKFCIRKYLSTDEFLFWNEGGIPSINEGMRKEAQKMIEWYDGKKQEN